MALVLPGNSAKVVNVNSWKIYLVGVLGLMLCVSGNELAQATTGVGPYVVPQVLDKDNDPSNGIETWIVAGEAVVAIGNGVTAKNAMTFKSCWMLTLLIVSAGHTRAEFGSRWETRSSCIM